MSKLGPLRLAFVREKRNTPEALAKRKAKADAKADAKRKATADAKADAKRKAEAEAEATAKALARAWTQPPHTPYLHQAQDPHVPTLQVLTSLYPHHALQGPMPRELAIASGLQVQDSAPASNLALALKSKSDEIIAKLLLEMKYKPSANAQAQIPKRKYPSTNAQARQVRLRFSR